jgi:hypothetical protein
VTARTVPPEKVRERFHLIHELEGCQKAVDCLTKHYGVRRMRIKLNGRKVGNGSIVSYCWNKAYFTKRGLNRRTALHELYHHLIYVNGLDMPTTKEQRAANSYARDCLSRATL